MSCRKNVIYGSHKSEQLLVTGASGFIGKNLVKALANNYHVLCSVRNHQDIEDCAHVIEIGPIQNYSKWETILGGVDCVVHLAAVAHNNYFVLSDNDVIREVNLMLLWHLQLLQLMLVCDVSCI